MSSMKKWEYKIVRSKFENMLSIGRLAVKEDGELTNKTIDEVFNILGEAGWELVTTGLPIGALNAMPHFVFKRPQE